MDRFFGVVLLAIFFYTTQAQEKGDIAPRGFQKENLFSGGSISLSFFSNTFLIGGSPVIGYLLGRFADGGVVVNYLYTSIRDYGGNLNYKVRQNLYGGGGFVRLYPLNFLFGQAQLEYNYITQKQIPPSGSSESKTISGRSLLVGGGYTSGRSPYQNGPFYYLSVLWDIGGDLNSPYTDALGRSVPVIRAGFTLPLFQGRSGRGYRR
ncbi:MAG: hypothetical protein ACKO6K_04950 [Chitinophagaceae bacterium]